MGCASSAASNQRPDAEAGEKAGHRPLVSENPGDAARKERRSPRTEEPAPAPPEGRALGPLGTSAARRYYNAITGETTTVTKAPPPPPPGSRLVGGVSSVSSEGDLADRPGRRRDSKVRFGAGGGERRDSNPKSMKRAWSSFIGI